MKQVGTALAQLLRTGSFVAGIDVYAESNLFALPDAFADAGGAPTVLVPFDLYTITTAQGLRLTYTTAPFPIAAPSADIFDAPAVYGSGRVWTAPMTWTPFPFDLRETRSTAHWKMGLDADTWQASAYPRQARPGAEPNDVYAESNVFAAPDIFSLADPLAGPDLIGAQPWLAAAAAGVLDDADCIIARAYFGAMPTYPLPPSGAVPVGTVILFRGAVGQVDITSASAVLTINDYRRLLQQQMPRNLYMSSCRHRFGDARCGVALSAYTQTATASAATTRAMVVATAAVPAPGGSATYALGTLTITSGRNAGFRRLVTTWNGADQFGLLAPFPYPVTAGDTFSVSAGCNKTLANCRAFANAPNYGGEPFIPPPETSLV